MTESVFVGYDPDTYDRAPVRFGARLAHALAEELVLASVYHAGPFTSRPAAGQFEEELSADAREALIHLHDEVSAQAPADLAVSTRLVAAVTVPRGLHLLLEEEAPAALVLG